MSIETKPKDLVIPALKSAKLGETIPEELCHYLKKYLSSTERGVISHNTSVGYHTVDKLIQGRNTLTKDNAPAMVEAIKMAIEKSQDEINDAKIAQRKLKSALA